MKDLWKDGVSDFKGEHFTMNDCKMLPKPSKDIPIVAAGQSGRGMEFASECADFNFVMGMGINSPTAITPGNKRLMEAAEKSGRDVGAYVLFMIIADETDELAEKKWNHYRDGQDVDALAWMADQGSKDSKADANATAKSINLPEGAVNFNMGTLVGSYEKVAGMMDELSEIPGTKGIMLTFDDFLVGLDQFGKRIQPLMNCRSKLLNGSNGTNGSKKRKTEA
jgi:pyrimidine oxygenase